MMKAGKDVESSNPVPSEFKTEEIETQSLKGWLHEGKKTWLREAQNPVQTLAFT